MWVIISYVEVLIVAIIIGIIGLNINVHH